MQAARRLFLVSVAVAMAAVAVAEAGAPPTGQGDKWRTQLALAVQSRNVPVATQIIDAALRRQLPGAEEEFVRAFRSPNAWIRRAALRGVVALTGTRTV